MRDRPSTRAIEAQESVCEMLEALKAVGISDREIAEHCRVDKTTVWRWRMGEHSPRLGHIVDLESMVERIAARVSNEAARMA